MNVDRVYLSTVSRKSPDLKKKKNLRKKKSHSRTKLTRFLSSRIAQIRRKIEGRRKSTLKNK